MGYIVQAKCKCGFQSLQAIGRGMFSPQNHLTFPCLCKKCKNIVYGDMLSDSLKCSFCKGSIISYDSNELLGEDLGEVAAIENACKQLGKNLVLKTGYYLCPKCDQYCLTFDRTGMRFD